MSEQVTVISTAEARPLVYWVETSRSKTAKSSYIRRMSTQSLEQAEFFYRCINLGNGYKKRLRVHAPSFGTTKVLRRASS